MTDNALTALNAPPLAEAFALVDKTFGIDKILSDEGRDDLVEPYYKQSAFGYENVHSDDAAMHLALIEGETYSPEGLETQARQVSAAITELGAKRVLEVGCGQAYNSRLLAGWHPDVEFVALDLLPMHVKKARERAKGLGNITIGEASYYALPDDLGTFDLIFGVETLCYAADPAHTARQIAARLAPGGRFMMHDVFLRRERAEMPGELARALSLYEITVVLPYGFRRAQVWEAALAEAGLAEAATEDLSPLTRTGLARLLRLSLKFFTSPKYRLAAKVMPKYLLRNSVHGIFGPYLHFGDPNAPDPARGMVHYGLVTATKPA